MNKLHALLITLFIISSCSSKTENQSGEKVIENEIENPSAEGFNEFESDIKAIEIADEVMLAQGGRKNWDSERFFTWNFFGARTLWWDKQQGDVRIQMHNEDSTVILVNVFDDTGKVFKNQQEIVQPDSVSKYVNKGKSIWINDSYWLFMPFKLKDTGVTLTYVGEDTTQSGLKSDVLQLMFENVGNTPQNKYHVWVDQNDHLVKQWSFYRDRNMTEPNFITPWEKYDKFGSLKLSGDRGRRQITDIDVPRELDRQLFENI